MASGEVPICYPNPTDDEVEKKKYEFLASKQNLVIVRPGVGRSAEHLEENCFKKVPAEKRKTINALAIYPCGGIGLCGFVSTHSSSAREVSYNNPPNGAFPTDLAEIRLI